MSRLHFLLIPLIILTLVVGCSQGGSPIAPDIAQSAMKSGVQNESSHALWGYWQCSYNRETGEIEAIPSRSSMWHINVVLTINSTMGLRVWIDFPASDPANGIVVADVTLTHPYPDYKQYTGFDVRGVMITTAPHSVDGMHLAAQDDPELLNADGYTRWWNPFEFTTPGLLGYTRGKFGIDPPNWLPITSVINPYKQFAGALNKFENLDDLKTIPLDGINGRGTFRAGYELTRRYEIQFPVEHNEPVTYFNYAIDASWTDPVPDPPNEVPDDFPISANSVEPWLVEATVVGHSFDYTAGSPSSGSLSVDLTIWDWQGMVLGYNGQLGSVRAYSPAINFSGPVNPAYTLNGDGSVSTSVTLNGTAVSYGTVPVWIGISCPGTTYSQGPEASPKGEIEAYTRVEITVPGSSGDMDWYVNAWIVRDSDGNNPATTPSRVQNDVDWANQFYSTWLGATVTLTDITYIDRTSWLALTTGEADDMFDQHGDRSGSLNVYYVDSTPDTPDAAGYSWMYCRFANQRSTTTYVIINDLGDAATLAHEMGHAVGMQEDSYLLDVYICGMLKQQSCPFSPSDIYCDENTAYYGNLMYYGIGENVNDYDITVDDLNMVTPDIDSQGENYVYFHTFYPDHFMAP